MQKTGIVMELNDDWMIVLGRDGQFSRLPRSAAMDVGFEVIWVEPESTATDSMANSGIKRRYGVRTWQRVALAGVAASMVIAVGLWARGGLMNPVAAEAYAFVSIDINPSISLEINSHLKVISADGTNSDGKALVGHLHLKGETLQTAVSNIVAGAAAEGMLPQQDIILISAAPGVSGTNVSRVQQEAASSAEAVVAHDAKVSVMHPIIYAIGVTQRVWKAADTAHVSPGQFATYLLASKEGYKGDLLQLKGLNLKNVLRKTPANDVEEMLGKESEKQIQSLVQTIQSLTHTSTVISSHDVPNKQNQTQDNMPQGEGYSVRGQEQSQNHEDHGKGHLHAPGSNINGVQGLMNSIFGNAQNSVHAPDNVEKGSSTHRDGRAKGSRDQKDGQHNSGGQTSPPSTHSDPSKHGITSRNDNSNDNGHDRRNQVTTNTLSNATQNFAQFLNSIQQGHANGDSGDTGDGG